MSSICLDECYEVALNLAREAGKTIKSTILQKKIYEAKSSDTDLVTETDKQIETFLRNGFLEKFPTHKFIGEESTANGEKCELTDDPTWIIDPIDGTMNFIHGFPYVAVSIGLVVKKQVEIGIVYNAVLEQMFTSRRNKGSYCNETKLEASGQQELSKSLIVSEIGGCRTPEKMDCVFTNMQNIIPKSHSFRAMGSAALNMCMVASGAADASYEYGIHCWDMAAGYLIVREAGGVVLDTEGGEFDLMNRRYLCAGSLTLANILSKELKHLSLERD